MWAVSVEIRPPSGNQIASVAQAIKQVLIQAFITHAPLKLSKNPFCIGLPGAISPAETEANYYYALERSDMAA